MVEICEKRSLQLILLQMGLKSPLSRYFCWFKLDHGAFSVANWNIALWVPSNFLMANWARLFMNTKALQWSRDLPCVSFSPKKTGTISYLATTSSELLFSVTKVLLVYNLPKTRRHDSDRGIENKLTSSCTKLSCSRGDEKSHLLHCHQ